MKLICIYRISKTKTFYNQIKPLQEKYSTDSPKQFSKPPTNKQSGSPHNHFKNHFILQHMCLKKENLHGCVPVLPPAPVTITVDKSAIVAETTTLSLVMPLLLVLTKNEDEEEGEEERDLWKGGGLPGCRINGNEHPTEFDLWQCRSLEEVLENETNGTRVAVAISSTTSRTDLYPSGGG